MTDNHVVLVYDWDPAKSARNEAVRGLGFETAMLLFKQPVLLRQDVRADYGEVRMCAVGRAGNHFLQCVFTDRGHIRRIISLRNASRKERDAYRATYPG